MRLVTRILFSLLVLALMGAVAWAQEQSTTDTHYLSVSYNVALVKLAAIAGGVSGDGLSESDRTVVAFTNANWTAGASLSAFATLTSSISYTLAGGRNAKVTAQLSALPAALSIWLRTTATIPESTTDAAAPANFWGNSTPVTGVELISTDSKNVVVVDTGQTAGIHYTDLPIFYDLQVDVTKGPAFIPTPINVVYTAQADGP
jgi:uncharacterized protein